jgi:hypothetical protein
VLLSSTNNITPTITIFVSAHILAHKQTVKEQFGRRETFDPFQFPYEEQRRWIQMIRVMQEQEAIL